MYDKIVEEYDRTARLNNIISSVPQQKKIYYRMMILWGVVSFVSMMIAYLYLSNSPISFFIVTIILLLFLFMSIYNEKQRKIIYKSKGCTTYEQYKLAMLKELLEKYNIHGREDIVEIISVTEKILATNSKNISWIYVLIAALALPYWNTFVQDQLLKHNYLGMAIFTIIAIVVCCYFRAAFDAFTRLFNTERSRQEFFYNQLTKYKYEILVRQKQEQF
ncbi:hypothetical protein HB815_00930 [Listeria booriae]|uniref:hypothetical protein n=1 Tax=Listeria booriae TaxID=1552123 RepID=UPI00162881CE|nr:hypothetical protein [Listeria booriae]MBC1209479.1 hypothetical protein [Listeria booriae]